MQLNSLTPGAGSKSPSKRVGRGGGSGLGKTCGRGHKGQRARAGGFHKVGFEGGQMPLQRRVPKFGFHSELKRVTAEVKIAALERIVGSVVNMEALRAAGLVRGNMRRAKVFGTGQLSRALTIKGLLVTKGARRMIEAAGGKVES